MGIVRQLFLLHIYLLLLVGGVLSIPQFPQTSYQINCMENTIEDTVLANLIATDSNGVNTVFTYSIEDNTYFKINTTGFVKVKSPIDAEGSDVSKVMTYVVTARDSTNPALSGTTTLSVTIDDFNEYKPTWSRLVYLNVKIYEGDPAGTHVVTIAASDRDRDSNWTFNFPPDLTDNFQYFKINAINGSITLNKTVNMADILSIQSNRNPFLIKPRVYDGKFTEFGAIYVTVLDKNHFAPEFVGLSDVQVNVDEGETGVLLTTFQATDDKEDPVQQVRYKVPNQQVPGSLRIGFTSGAVTLVKALDRETIPGGQIIQLITAEDDGNPGPVLTTTATLTITVNDVNDNIPKYDVPSYELRLPQIYKVGVTHGLPLATDPDEGENGRVVYQLSPEAEIYFTIDPDTSVLTTRSDCGQGCIRVVDCFLEPVKVYAFNPGAPSSTDTLLVNITLTAASSPGSTPPSSANIVSCADANVPNDFDPEFPLTKTTVQIPESTTVNVTITTLTATDNDFGTSGDITYSVDSPDFGVTQNGDVFLKKTFDFEDPAQRDVCMNVIATDKGTPPRSSSTQLCVNVTNSNDNEPRFPQKIYHATLTDGEQVATSVAQITANDADGTSDLTYEIVPPVTYLDIDPTSGQITVTEQIIGSNILTGSSGDSVQITVRVTNGPFSAETTLNLTIESSNKFDPVFDAFVADLTVDEGSTGIIIKLTATDADTLQTISYQLAEPAFSGIFGVSSTTGDVSVISNIDRENLPALLNGGAFVLEVLAIDDGFPVQRTGTASVNINIGDVNDNVPRFTGTVYELRLLENFAVGEQFQLPTATDQDIGQNAVILYNISSTADSFFSSNGNVLTTTVACGEECIKAEDCSLVEFSVWAYNGDLPDQRNELRVYVSLLKLGSTLPISADPAVLQKCSSVATPNDNAPKFIDPNYTVDVKEGTSNNTVVIKVNTTDADFGDSGEIVYTITNSTDFTINDQGQISTARELDYENPNDRVICMEVVATDKGTPPLSASTVVCVIVLNENDEPPVFTELQYTASVFDQDGPGTFVKIISTNDKDVDSTIQYDFVAAQEYFQIDPRTGNVTALKTIDRAAILASFPNAKVIVQVRATDGKHLIIAQLEITVLESNTFGPRFDDDEIDTSVDEEVSGVDVIQVTAQDGDVTKQPITYELVLSTVPVGVFTVDRVTGQIRLERAIDRESVDTVVLVVEAKDIGNPPPQKSSSVTIRVKINDINDNVPAFPQDFYEIQIFQNFTAGESYPLPNATDEDINGVIRYDISDNAKQFFDIDPITGAVTTRTNCEGSCKKLTDCHFMKFTVWSFNPSSPLERDSLQVNLTLLTLQGSRSSSADIPACSQASTPNENDPKFIDPNYTVDVKEGTSVNTVVIKVNTTDADFGDSGEIVYTITNSTDFTINDQGQISTARELNYESPNNDRVICMEVVATDKGTPPRSASTVVCVNVLNENDQPPVFTELIYTASVFDQDGPGTFVKVISANDKDVDSTIHYDFVAPQEYLQIDPRTGNVTVLKTIDRAAILGSSTTATVIVQARASDGKYLIITRLRVTVLENNKFGPRFVDDVLDTSVDEEVSGVDVIQVTAQDDDVTKQPITYELISSTAPDGVFTVDRVTGQIRLEGAIDRESLDVDTVVLVVEAKDIGNPPPQKSSSVTIQVKINDINDNVPAFPQDFYEIQIFQNFTAGESYPLLTATDEDINGVIRYEMSDNAKQFFDIDPITGAVTTRTNCEGSCKKLTDCHFMEFTVWSFNPSSPLERDSLQVNLTLLTLQGSRSSSADIPACSQASTPNENDPKFIDPNYTVDVKEGTSVNTVVIKVNTTDADFGDSGEIVYTITNSTDFTINDQGQISTARELNYESPNNDRVICMEVNATDKGTPPRSASTVVCVNVLNENDQPPVFTELIYTASVFDQDGPGTFVKVISANDKDVDSTIQYDFVAPQEYFQIDPRTGNVTVLKTIDRAAILGSSTTATVIVQARASDGKYLIITRLRVTVLENNKFGPRFVDDVLDTSVDEEVSGVDVIQVTAQDDDVTKQPITYELISSTAPDGVFTVDRVTGQIRLEGAIDRESLDVDTVVLVVEAKDIGNPPPQKSSSVTIQVKINDINDNVPAFPQDFYEIQIYQNFTAGESYPLPKATDEDINGVIRYEISDNAKQFFDTDPITGAVTTRTNCEGSCKKLTDCHFMEFTVWSFNPSSPLERDSLQVNLTLLTLQGSRSSFADIPACSQASTPNENDPKFIDPNYTVDVKEGTSVNTVVIKVNTTDADFGDSGEIVYTITNSTDFTINDQGQIFTARELNYDNPNNDRLICIQVNATDKGTPPRSASTVVCVNVLNENDQPPVFTELIYTASVFDQDGPGTFVKVISANDKDVDSTIQYDFVAPQEYFQIDLRTGNVTVLKTIDRAAILRSSPTGIVTVQARASDGKYLIITRLRVTVLENNKFGPRFADDVIDISVDEEVSGVDVVQVTAQDDDVTKQPITYELISSNAPDGVFTVDPGTGQIRLERAIDRESVDTIVLVVEAKDIGNPPPQKSSSVTIRVKINDINDNVPTFPQDFYEIQIFQNFTVGELYPLPKATDEDINGVIRYEMSDNAKQFFDIDPITGSVTTRTNCEGSCKKLTDCHFMEFTVWSFNPSSPLERDTLQVNLTLLTLQGSRSSSADIPACSQASTPNENDPKFIDPNYTVDVKEGTSVNTVVIKVNTTDADFGDSGEIVYTITNSTDFTINDQGQISTARELNSENPDNDKLICIQVNATDKGTPPRSASTVVCVNVLNVNDQPPIFTELLYTAFVFDQDGPGTFVKVISANDKDVDSTIKYDFIAPQEYFQIDPRTGNVTVLKTIDRAAILASSPSARVIVQARASDGKFLIITQLRITVMAINKFAPRFNVTVIDTSVDEEVSGVDVIQVTALDDDLPRQPITYAIVNSTVPAGVFSVNPVTGQIRLDQSIDRERLTDDVVTLVVMAADTGNPPPQKSTSVTVHVTINDINDNMPNFPLDFYQLQIAQNFTAGDIFALPKATDADVTSVIRYELSDNAKQFFTLNPTLGTLSTRTTCDSTCVKLVDCHYMTFTLSAFNPSNTAMRDTLDVSLTLLTVQGTTGSSVVLPACSDAATPNDNDPKFDNSQPSVDVKEGVPPGSIIIKLNSTDADFGDSGKVDYIITNSTDFGVNEDGEVVNLVDLDYETIKDPVVCMEVRATDRGQPPRNASAVLCITIINVNEHSPAFPSGTYFASVNDGDPASTFVVQVTASDDDANTQLSYAFVSPSPYFQIDSVSGNVTVTKTIDRKDALGSSTTNFVPLQVRASDGQRSTIAELQVTIVENNDFAPDFGGTFFNASIQEESLTNPVFTVTATDGDRVNEIITYSILNSTLPGVFTISSRSGEIRMTRALDLETLSPSYIDLVVVAVDSGRPSPQRSSTATVRVTVTDINDNQPTFSVGEYTAEIYQNFSSGDVVIIPTASDPDVNDNIIYSLDPSSDTWFEVDPNTGVLRIRQDCAEECVKIEDCFYGQLTINAFNADNPSTKATLSVTINLLTTETDDKIISPTGTLVPCTTARSPNKNDPKFDKPNYEPDLNENSPENTVVVVVTASDDDFGNSGKVTYSIKNSTDYGINDKGEIFVINPPDYEDPNRRRDCFEVIAADKGTPPRQTSTVVCVNIINLNDNDPVFGNPTTQATAQDGDAPPKFIVQITATDADPGTKLTYSIDGGNPYFQIDPNSGNITVSSTIDRAQITADTGSSLVPLTILATDSQNVVSTRLLISISRKNEHPPKFATERYETGVDEESTKVDMIQVQATDNDLPRRPVDYFIQTGNFSDHFAIDRVTGQISVVKTFDRESLGVDSVEVTVVAVDSGDPPPKRSSTATVAVRIMDINDHPPKYAQENFEIRLFQNFSSGISRQLPQATDADLGQNAAVSYELSSGVGTYFDLDPSTALLTTSSGCRQCVKKEEFEWLVFTVTAFNGGRPAVTDQLQVTVILMPIGNVSITDPIVAPVLMTKTVTLNIATAKVTDLVFDMNTMIEEGTYNYSMSTDNNTLTYFELRPDGSIVLSRVPDISEKSFTMRVYAVQGGNKPQNNTVNLVVNLVNDTYLDEKGIAAISAICAIALLIIILAIVHIIWWKTRHKKDKESVMEDEATTGCCCGKPIIAIKFPVGEESSF